MDTTGVVGASQTSHRVSVGPTKAYRSGGFHGSKIQLPCNVRSRVSSFIPSWQAMPFHKRKNLTKHFSLRESMYNKQFDRWGLQKRPRRNTSDPVQREANVENESDIGHKYSTHTVSQSHTIKEATESAILPWKSQFDSPGCDLVPAASQVHQRFFKMPSSVVSAGDEEWRSSHKQFWSSSPRSSTFSGLASFKRAFRPIKNCSNKILPNHPADAGDETYEHKSPEQHTLPSNGTLSSNENQDPSEFDFRFGHEDAVDDDWVDLDGVSVNEDGETGVSMRRSLLFPCSSY